MGSPTGARLQRPGAQCRLPIIIPSSYGHGNGEGARLQQHCWVQLLSPVFLTLKSIAQKAARTLNVGLDVEFYEERLQKNDHYLEEIVARSRSGEPCLAFISCKSMELSRGIDVARRLRTAGVDVVMGGPGVTLPDVKTYRYLYSNGISFNAGEGESTIPLILADFLNGRLRPCYAQVGYVDLGAAPMPSHPRPSDLRGAVGGYVGLSTSEGCPFDCSYCSEWVLRGRQTRARDPRAVADWVERAYTVYGLRRFFITDDNFRRSPKFFETVEILAKLNARLGGALRFMAQLDVKDVIRDVPALAAMGVRRVFVGMESLDPNVVHDVLGKRQNDPALYAATVREFHSRGILVDTGWMVGFPHQTPESMIKEADQIAGTADFVYPFFVTPLPGTVDYAQAIRDGTLRSWDPNDYTTRRPLRDWFEHSSMDEMWAAYNQTFFHLFSIRNIFGGGSPCRWDRFELRLLARLLAEGGRLRRGVPLHYMMEGWPRGSRVSRPADSFRGVTLMPEDIKAGRKEEALQEMGACFSNPPRHSSSCCFNSNLPSEQEEAAATKSAPVRPK